MNERPFCVVTGASRGIGRAIAISLAHAGHDLALVCRSNKNQLKQTSVLAKAAGAECVESIIDVACEEDVLRLFDELKDESHRLTGLVNNAGYAGKRQNLSKLPMDEIDRVVAVNLRGPILMCRQAVPIMTANGRGAIVNVSSQSAQFGGLGLTAYAASKAALNGLTVSLARETGASGVRVNAISPGPVLTDELLTLPEERLEAMRSNMPMGRFCTAEEVAGVVTWLQSDQATYVSGAVIPVHGAR